MLEKIKELLKKYGIDEKHADKIKVENEADIEKAVFNYAVDLKAGSFVDQRVNQALETYEKKRKESDAKKPEQKTEPKPETKADEKAESPDIKSIIQGAIQEAIKPILSEVETLKTSNKKETREKLVKAALEAAKLEADWAETITGDDPDSINNSVKAIKDRIDKKQQEIINTELKKGGANGNGKGGELGKSIVEEIAKAKNTKGTETAVPDAAPLPGIGANK